MLVQPGANERILQIALALAVTLLIHDLVVAFGATACAAASSQDCYPWGTEGPSGDLWHYASKETYLVSGIAAVGLLVLAMIIPFFTRARQVGLCAMIAVLIIGLLSLEAMVTALMPAS